MSPPSRRAFTEFLLQTPAKEGERFLKAGWLTEVYRPAPQVSPNLTRGLWRKSAAAGFRMDNGYVNELARGASSLISLGKLAEQDYRVKRCCGRRPTEAGGVGVDGPPNKRSKNDGPEEVLSLAKLTPAGRLEPAGRE